MSTTAVITEYNPFHNGHQYHLNKSREITGNDDLIVIMSGNFTQRAEPAILDKWARTAQALSCGADLVIELPLLFDIRSAEYFAYYSLLTLEKTNLVDSIVFGSESGNIDILSAIARSFVNENIDFKNHLNCFLKEGLDFPTARRKALIKSFENIPDLKNFSKKEVEKVLKEPNNILGIEYLKSLFRLKSKIKAHTIKRYGADYHSDKINNDFASASLIRKIIKNNSVEIALNKSKNLMPNNAWEIMKSELKSGRFAKNDANNLILNKIIDQLRRLNAAELLKYKGISNGIENRIIQAAVENSKAENFLESIKCKNLTESRIRRKLLQIYFKLDAEKIEKIEKNAPHYLRILGVKKGKEYLLSMLQQKSELEVIVNPASKINELSLKADSNPLNLSLSYDLLASDLYALLYQNQKYSKAQRDFHQKLIKI